MVIDEAKVVWEAGGTKLTNLRCNGGSIFATEQEGEGSRMLKGEISNQLLVQKKIRQQIDTLEKAMEGSE